MPTETKCPQCGSTNVVQYIASFECFGCGYKEEASDLTFDPTKCPQCGSLNPSPDEGGFTCENCGCNNYPVLFEYDRDE
jgi:hypothetical protein